MQDELLKLLEEIEAAPLGNPPIVRDLIKAVNQNNVVVERRKILKDAFEKGYIEDVDYSPDFNDDRRLRLKIEQCASLDRIINYFVKTNTFLGYRR